MVLRLLFGSKFNENANSEINYYKNKRICVGNLGVNISYRKSRIFFLFVGNNAFYDKNSCSVKDDIKE